jgi:hypothetical protein
VGEKEKRRSGEFETGRSCIPHTANRIPFERRENVKN